MKKKIFKHFLSAFLITIPIVVIPFIGGFINEKSSEELKALIIVLFSLLILGTLIGGLMSFKFGDKFRSKQEKRLYNKRLFLNFMEKHNFVNHKTFLDGFVNEYFISIFQREAYPQRWLEVQIIFNPKQGEQFIPVHVFKKLYKVNPKHFTWSSNMLTIKKVYGINLPKYETIKSLIDQVIESFVKNNIDAISLEKWEEVTLEAQNHYKQISSLNV